MASRPPSRPITDFFKPFSNSQHKRAFAADNSSSASSEIESKASPVNEKSRANISKTPDKRRKRTGEREKNEVEAINQNESLQESTCLETISSSLTSLSSTPTVVSAAETTRKVICKSESERKSRIIRSSDTEEDDEYHSNSDSDSSLEDLTVILARVKNSATSNAQSGTNHINDTNEAGNGGRRSTRLRNVQSSHFSGNKARVDSAVPKTDYKFSLGSLLDKAGEEEAAQARLAAIKARIDAMSKLQSDRALSRKACDIDEKLLASVVRDDEDEDGNERAQRVLQAMERTDALRMDCVWHFFAEGWLSPPSNPFPVHSLPNAGWQTLLKVPAKREIAFLSGFVETMCLHQNLPVDILSWICDEVCTESREDLSYAYLGVLEAAQEDLEDIITPTWLDQVLVNRLGARDKAIAVDQKLAMQVRSFGVSKRKIPGGFDAFLNLLIRISSSLSEECMFHAMQVLIRLSVDDSILSSSSHQHLIRQCFATLLNSLEQRSVDIMLEKLSQRIYQTFASNAIPVYLQYSLLSRTLLLSQPINVSSITLFSRRLALAFFLSSSSPLTLPITKLGSRVLSAIEQRLERMRVTIALGSRATNAGGTDSAAASNDDGDWDIVSKIGLLDIGIGAGLDTVRQENENGMENATSNKVNDDGHGNKTINNINVNGDIDSNDATISKIPDSQSNNPTSILDSNSKSHFNFRPAASSTQPPSSSSVSQRHPSQLITTAAAAAAAATNLNPIIRSLNRLSASLSSAASGISSMSANHVQRTEAKAALDRLIYRLEYACDGNGVGRSSRRRIGKGGGTRGIDIGIDDDDGGDEAAEGKVFMERFLGL